MGYDPERHHRQSIRLKGYDYSRSGYYFVTICAQDRKKLFGEINDAIVRLNEAGQMVEQEWNKIPKRYDNVIVDQYIIMPNHFHGILQITPKNNVGTPPVAVLNKTNKISIPPNKIGISMTNRAATGGAPTLFEIIGAFKSITTHHYINGVKQNNWQPFRKRLWQLKYHDRIIRDAGELDRIRKYIIKNPSNWERDKDNPEKKS